MAESSLSATYAEIRQAIAHYLGLSLTDTDWSANEIALIAIILKRGLRQFYKPPKVFDDQPPHRWSFLAPIESITTIASYTTGTIAVAVGGTIVTLTDGVFPSWAASHGTLVVDSVAYAIATRTNDTHIELSSAWTEDALTAETYELRHDGNYDMDEDFGGVDGLFMTFGEGSNNSDVKLISESEIRNKRASDDTRGTPQYFAVRPKNITITSTTGQRFEMMFYPVPDEAEAIYYNKIVHPETLDGTTQVYPLGGMAYGDCIVKSCIAAAEEDQTDKRGSKWESFISAMTSAIREDQTAMQSNLLGYNGDNSDNVHNTPDVRTLSGLVTYVPTE